MWEASDAPLLLAYLIAVYVSRWLSANCVQTIVLNEGKVRQKMGWQSLHGAGDEI
jgi:hypothetical protein